MVWSSSSSPRERKETTVQVSPAPSPSGRAAAARAGENDRGSLHTSPNPPNPVELGRGHSLSHIVIHSQPPSRERTSNSYSVQVHSNDGGRRVRDARASSGSACNAYYNTHTHTHTHMHSHSHSRTHTHTHARAYTPRTWADLCVDHRVRVGMEVRIEQKAGFLRPEGREPTPVSAPNPGI